ncbi:MAG TPA: ankyrin repeat domain-containing protein [Candidatus Babeliales bacterium]|nr:ankyrin repeat domain-containing protein [Candidatus Babeliales bacterium]
MKKVVAFCAPCIFLMINIIAMEQDNFVTDMWNKIIAQLPDSDKNRINHSCKTLNSLCKRTNHHIYIHAPLNLSDRNVITALLYATHYQNTRAIKNLLEHGANPNDEMRLPLLPLSLAKYQNNQKNIKLLEKHGAQNYTPMCPIYSLAAFVGDLPLLKTYINDDKTLTPFEQLYSSNPFLHDAIFNGHTHIIEYVLQTPSLRYLKDMRHKNTTTIYFAALNDRATIIQLLLKESPYMINNICGEGRFTALHIAIVRNRNHVAKILLAHPNIEVNICDGDGNTPLHRAVGDANVELTRLLLDRPDIKINYRNNKNLTPLDIAHNLHNDELKELFRKRDAKTYFYMTKIAQWEQNKKI